jgi:hypothetical protein
VADPGWARKGHVRQYQVMFLSISAAAAVSLIPMYKTYALMELHFPKYSKPMVLEAAIQYGGLMRALSNKF